MMGRKHTPHTHIYFVSDGFLETIESFDEIKKACTICCHPKSSWVRPFSDGSKVVRVISLILLDFPDFLSLPKIRVIGDISTKNDFLKSSEERQFQYTKRHEK